MISKGTRPFYADYDPKFEAELDKNMDDLVKAELGVEDFWPGKKYLNIDISCSIRGGDFDGDEAITPPVRYIL